MRTKKEILLYVIILGIVLNLIANVIWKYIPKETSHVDEVISGVLLLICVLLLVFHKSQETSRAIIDIVSAKDKENPSIARSGKFMDLAFGGIICNNGNQQGVISEITEALLIMRKGKYKLEFRNTKEIKLNYEGKNEVRLRYNPITVSKGERIPFNFRVETDLTIEEIERLSESEDYRSVLLNPDRIEFILKYKVVEGEVVKPKEMNIEVVDRTNITDYIKRFS